MKTKTKKNKNLMVQLDRKNISIYNTLLEVVSSFLR